MLDGFEYAPRPMAIFDTTGTTIAQNRADRQAFGDLTLLQRYSDFGAGAEALDQALKTGEFSETANLTDNHQKWRISLRRLNSADVGVTILAEFADHTRSYNEGHLQAGVGRTALASIAHDFRAPLTAITGFAALLERGDVSPDRRAMYLRAIQTASSGLTDLADRMVQLGQHETAPLSTIDLNDLVQECLAVPLEDAQSSGTRLIVSPDAAAGQVIGDRVATTRILQNLISNALRHSGADAIRLTTGPGWFEVSDNGCGMMPDAVSSGLSGHACAQLGLSNVAALVRDMAADLDIKTAPGAGFSARVTFAL